MLVVALGVACRSGRGAWRLVVDEAVEDLVDHAEVASGVGELALDVDEVLGEPVQAARRRPEHGQRRSGVLGEERLRVLDHPYLDLLCELTARPVDHDLSVLQDNEQALADDFASRAFHAASLTQGEVRTAFVYIDGDTSTSRELEDWADERGYQTTFSLDPAWDAVRRFR